MSITLVFILLAGVLIPPLTGAEFTSELDALTVGLSRVLFPIVVLLGLNGLVVGILNAYDHFTIPALAPLVWNLVIIAVLVGLTPRFEGDEPHLRVRDRRARWDRGAVRDDASPMLRRVGFRLRISLRLARSRGSGACSR